MISRIVISMIFEWGGTGAVDVYESAKERKVQFDRDERTRPRPDHPRT